MQVNIYPNHQRGIANLVKSYKDDSRFDALIIGGSVAKGLARLDSDVDFMIVANDDEFKKCKENNDFFINRTDLTDYSGGFVDGKIIDLEYLKKVSKEGNEPTRAAFDGAFVPFSRIDTIEMLISEIVKYPEKNRDQKLKSFYSMSFIQNWMMGEAERHDNLYTKSRAASQLVLFAGRLILAYNRVFFPYHKWFYEYLSRCKNKPEGIIDKMNGLLLEPNTRNSKTLFISIRDFFDWGVSDIEAFSWFMKNMELSWMDGNQSFEDW